MAVPPQPDGTPSPSQPAQPPRLTLLRQVVVLRLPLHLLAPALHLLHLCLQQLDEPLPVAVAGGGPAGVGEAAGAPLHPGIPPGHLHRVVLQLVVLPVRPLPLRVHRLVDGVLPAGLGLRGVPLEGAPELQGFVLGGHGQAGEALQLQVRLHARRHAVGALEAGSPAESESAWGPLQPALLPCPRAGCHGGQGEGCLRAGWGWGCRSASRSIRGCGESPEQPQRNPSVPHLLCSQPVSMATGAGPRMERSVHQGCVGTLPELPSHGPRRSRHVALPPQPKRHASLQKSPEVSSAPGPGSNPGAEPQQRRTECGVGAGEPPPRAVRGHVPCDGDGAELWGPRLEQRGKRRCGAAQGALGVPKPLVPRAWQVSAQPGRAVPFVLLHLHPNGVELPLAPAFCIRVRDGFNLPRGRGRALEGSLRCGTAAQHRPRHPGRLGAGSEPTGSSEAHLDADGRTPLPLPSQAPQLLPAGDGLDDECGGLGSRAGLDRRQVEGHGRHLGALQALGRVATGRGVFGPGRAAGGLAGQVALMGGLGAALRRDGDEGFGFGSWRDGRWSFSVTEGCCGRGAG